MTCPESPLFPWLLSHEWDMEILGQGISKLGGNTWGHPTGLPHWGPAEKGTGFPVATVTWLPNQARLKDFSATCVDIQGPGLCSPLALLTMLAWPQLLLPSAVERGKLSTGHFLEL